MVFFIFIQQYPGLPTKLSRPEIRFIYVRNRDKRIFIKRDELRIDVSQPRIIKSNKAGNLAIREKDLSDSDLPSDKTYQDRATTNNGLNSKIPLALRDDRDHDKNNSSSIEKQPGNLDSKKPKLNHSQNKLINSGLRTGYRFSQRLDDLLPHDKNHDRISNTLEKLIREQLLKNSES